MKLLVMIMLTALLWGCSSENDRAITVDATGKHQPGWLAAHSTSFLDSSTVCKDCHGATLTGGISGVSCSTASFDGVYCHANGPHPIPWPGHNQSTNQFNNCSPCHGAGLTGGANAPACSSCHTQLPPGTVPIIGTCVSCHAAPPDGLVFPNISGSHKAHTVLPLECAVCHSGGGSGTPTHGKSLTVAFPVAYNAKTGAAVMNPDGTCATVSCHGGQTTPAWRGGRKLDPNQDCTFCHAAGTAQFNSYNSGEHDKHLIDAGLFCVDCHDMTAVSAGAYHFSGLGTPTFELNPNLTLNKSVNKNLNYINGSCTPSGNFSISVCHATKSWR